MTHSHGPSNERLQTVCLDWFVCKKYAQLLTCHVTQCQGGIEKKEYYRDEMQCGPILLSLTESLPTLQKLSLLLGANCSFS